MENPYAPPLTEASPRSAVASTGITGVAVASVAAFCAFAAYAPFGLRGAFYGMFPGLVQRSIRVAMLGAALGCVSDIGVTIVCLIVGGVWEPRWGGFNEDLVRLPPGFIVISHAGSSVPNSMKFGIGIVMWSVTMHALWASLWRPKLSATTRQLIVAASAVTAGLCATLLWTVAPLTVMDGSRHQPFADLPSEVFRAVLFASMPVLAMFVACLMYIKAQSQRAASILDSTAEPSVQPEPPIARDCKS